jgi:hypothetical protein
MVFTANLSTLPAAQRALWLELEATPDHFTIYGGTALALYFGHRLTRSDAANERDEAIA